MRAGDGEESVADVECRGWREGRGGVERLRMERRAGRRWSGGGGGNAISQIPSRQRREEREEESKVRDGSGVDQFFPPYVFLWWQVSRK